MFLHKEGKLLYVRALSVILILMLAMPAAPQPSSPISAVSKDCGSWLEPATELAYDDGKSEIYLPMPATGQRPAVAFQPFAADVPDQAQPVASERQAVYFGGTTILAQTFQADLAGPLGQVMVYLSRGNATAYGDVRATLRRCDAAGYPTGDLLASVRLPEAAILGPAWYTIPLTSRTSLIPDTAYGLILAAPEASGDTAYRWFAASGGATGDPYPGGQALRSQGSGLWTSAGQHLDFAFQTSVRLPRWNAPWLELQAVRFTAFGPPKTQARVSLWVDGDEDGTPDQELTTINAEVQGSRVEPRWTDVLVSDFPPPPWSYCRLDQGQTSLRLGGRTFGNFGGPMAKAQTFRPAQSAPLCSVQVPIAAVPGPVHDAIAVEIYPTDTTGAPAGAPLATATLGTVSSVTPSWYVASFGAGLNLAQGVAYALVLTSTNSGRGAYSWYGDDRDAAGGFDPYRHGQSWEMEEPGGWGALAANTDLAFRASLSSQWWPNAWGDQPLWAVVDAELAVLGADTSSAYQGRTWFINPASPAQPAGEANGNFLIRLVVAPHNNPLPFVADGQQPPSDPGYGLITSTWSTPTAVINVADYWDRVRRHPGAVGAMNGWDDKIAAGHAGWFLDTNDVAPPHDGHVGTLGRDVPAGIVNYARWDATNTLGNPLVPPPGKIGQPWSAWTVDQQPLGWGDLKAEIDAGRPVVTTVVFWNPIDTGIEDSAARYYTWGPQITGTAQLTTTYPLTFTESFVHGHAVTVVGYRENYTPPTSSLPATNWLIVHDTWPGTGLNRPAAPEDGNMAVPFDLWLGNRYAWLGNSHVAVDSDLAVNVATTSALVVPGEPVTYTLTFAGQGPGVAWGAVLTAILPSELVTVSFVSAGPPITPVLGSRYVWALGDLAPGQGGTITITGYVDPALNDPEHTFVGLAEIGAAIFDPDLGNNRSRLGTTILTADLQVFKKGPTYAFPGQTIRYVVVYNNAGPAAAQSVLLHDYLPTGLTYITDTAPFPRAITGNHIVWNLGTLPPDTGGSIAITAQVTLTFQVGDVFTNTVGSATSTPESEYSNNGDVVATSVLLPRIYLPVLLRGYPTP